jgi:hypothetical protein
MPTVKPPHTGDGAGRKPRDFSSGLKANLRGFAPLGVEPGKFVAEVLGEARWLPEELEHHRITLGRDELKAEHRHVLKWLRKIQNRPTPARLRKAENALRSISRDLDALLGVHVDPVGCADGLREMIDAETAQATPPTTVKLREMVNALEEATARIAEGPTARRPEIQRRAAVETAVRVLRVLKDYGITPSATMNPAYGFVSPAIKILQAIGDDIGWRRDPVTWRAIILDAKRNAADLK